MCIAKLRPLVEKSWLLVFDSQFTIHSGKDTLHLTQCKHTTQQGVAGIVAVARFVHDSTWFVGKCHTVVDTHRQLWIFLLENPTQFNEVGTTIQVTGLREVAIGEDVARAQVYEVGA